jgi:hypothetical protein
VISGTSPGINCVNLKLFNFFSSLASLLILNFSYVGSYRYSAKKTPASTVPVSISLHYYRYVLQQAGYQPSSVMVAAGTLLRNMPFKTCHSMYL